MSKWLWLFGAMILLALLAPNAHCTGNAQPSLAPSAAPVAAGGGETWLKRVGEGLERDEYVASWTEQGLQAPNRAQNLRAWFRSNGVQLRQRTADEGAWQWRWRTARWGRPGRMRHAEAVSPVARGSRVEYLRKGLVEWYENRSQGLEQGFTVATRPGGLGPLRIEGRLASGIRMTPSSDGRELDFVDETGACVLRYGKLVVWDAVGARLPARLAAEDRGVAIEVDDRAAAYPITIDPLMTNPAWSVQTGQPGALFSSVGTAGDVNGDGYSDVILGSASYDNGQVREGRAFVYLGSAAGLSVSPAWTAESNQEGAAFGIEVATAGDVNGDGYSDVVVSATNYSNGQTNEGRAFVYLGSAVGLSASPAWTAEGNQINAYYGGSVATAGDVNNDGYADVIVGAPTYDNGQTDEGKAYLYLGSAAGLGASPIWTAEGDSATAIFGVSVRTAGDVNGDGHSDVVVRALMCPFGTCEDFDWRGRAYVYHGSAAGLATSPAWIANGDSPRAEFGLGDTAGDVNGDGYSDVIVGAPGHQNDLGSASVYHGSAMGLTATPAWTRVGQQSFEYFGSRVATAGDVDGDGYSDVIIGSYLYDTEQENAGRAFVFSGSANGLSSSPAWTSEGNLIGGFFGHSLGSAGDVNGDGYSDVIVSEQLHAHVYHGSGSGVAVPDRDARDGLQPVAVRPNPFHSQVSLHYVLPRGSRTTLSLFDVRGRRIAVLVERVQEAGAHSVMWNGRDDGGQAVPAGIYSVRLESGGKMVSRKLVRR
ncbi:MAG: FG-GAP-like repeat-containing protein [Candidatus Eiseniibacteriota bacterium]